MPRPIEPYRCAFSVSNEILTCCASISFKLGRLSLTYERKVEPSDLALATKSTLALEGIDIKPSYMRGLNRGEEVALAPLASAVYSLYAKMPKYDPWDKELLELFETSIWKEGVPHRLSRRIPSFPYTIPMHARIEPLMNGLYAFMEGKRHLVHPLVMGCNVYFEVLAIMPYSEYNGLLARFLLKAFLGSYCSALYGLPLERLMLVHKDEIEKAYAEAVEKADTAPFVTCMVALIEQGVDALIRASVRPAANQSPLVSKMLGKMESGRFYSAVELCELLGLKSRLGLQKNYLRPALEAQLIEMSNPVSHTDRTQRYCKK